MCAYARSGKYLSAYERGGAVSYEDEPEFYEHFTIHELADSACDGTKVCSNADRLTIRNADNLKITNSKTHAARVMAQRYA